MQRLFIYNRQRFCLIISADEGINYCVYSRQRLSNSPRWFPSLVGSTSTSWNLPSHGGYHAKFRRNGAGFQKFWPHV